MVNARSKLPEQKSAKESMLSRPDMTNSDISREYGDIYLRMIKFLEFHYSRTLGDDAEFLRKPGGLDYLAAKYNL